MTLLILDKPSYSSNFIRNGLPAYISKYFIDFASSKKYSGIIQELNQRYDIVIKDISKALRPAIHYSETDDSYIISVSDAYACKKYNLSMILRFLDYGSRSIRGNHIILDFTKQLQQDMPDIYKLFRRARGLKIWV